MMLCLSCLLALLFSCRYQQLGSQSENFYEETHYVNIDTSRAFFNFDSFPKVKQVEGESLHLFHELGDLNHCQLVEDRYLIFNGLINGHHSHILDLETSELTHFARDGRGPGEVIHSWTFTYREKDRSLWVYDYKRRVMVGYSMDQLLNGQDPSAESEMFDFSYDVVQHPKWITDSTIVGLTYDKVNGRLFYFDERGKFIRKAGKLPPKNDPRIVDFVWAQVHQAELALAPDRQHLVSAVKNATEFELYDKEGNELARLAGPELYHNIWMPFKVGLNQNYITSNKARNAYPSVSASNEGPFLLYSGRRDIDAPTGDNGEARPYWDAHSDKVLFFSWEGKPEILYQLDREVIDIAVDSKGRYLYGVNYEEPEIYRFDLQSPKP